MGVDGRAGSMPINPQMRALLSKGRAMDAASSAGPQFANGSAPGGYTPSSSKTTPKTIRMKGGEKDRLGGFKYFVQAPATIWITSEDSSVVEVGLRVHARVCVCRGWGRVDLCVSFVPLFIARVSACYRLCSCACLRVCVLRAIVWRIRTL